MTKTKRTDTKPFVLVMILCMGLYLFLYISIFILKKTTPLATLAPSGAPRTIQMTPQKGGE